MRWLVAACVVVSCPVSSKASESGLGYAYCALEEAREIAGRLGMNSSVFEAGKQQIWATLSERANWTILETDPDYAAAGHGKVDIQPLRRAQPKFPPNALITGTSGVLLLLVKIDRNGQSVRVFVLGADPAGVFDEAAVKALMDWTFRVNSGTAASQFWYARVRLAFCNDLDSIAN